jgi:DNA polymerase-3 subunit epsilon
MKDCPRHLYLASSNNNQTADPSQAIGPEGLGSMCEAAIASLVSRLALSRPLAVVDLETTGVSVERDRILQIGIVRIEPDGNHLEFDRLVNPEMPIPPEATAVHGITDGMVADAPTFKILEPEVSQFLVGCDFAGYNVRRFDRKLLEAEYARVGAAYPLNGAKLVDAFLIFVQREARTLTGAMKFYCGMPDFLGHKAIDDVKATVCVMAGQLARYPDLPASVDGLDAFCDQRDPSWIDPDGKIAFRDGEAVITFGKNAGRKLRDLARTDPDYLRWMLTKDFSAAVKAVVSHALRGSFPRDPARDDAASEVPAVSPKAALEGQLAPDDGKCDPAWPDVLETSWPDLDDK